MTFALTSSASKTPSRRRNTGDQRFQTDWLWRALSSTGQTSSVLFQVVRVGFPAEMTTWSDESGGPCRLSTSYSG